MWKTKRLCKQLEHGAEYTRNMLTEVVVPGWSKFRNNQSGQIAESAKPWIQGAYVSLGNQLTLWAQSVLDISAFP